MSKAATNKEVRVYNQKSIVNTLFHRGPMTKQELADHLGLSLPTISVIFKNLAEKGLVARGEKLESSGGRPPSHVTLVFDARLAIGIDVSTSHVRLALVNLGPRLVSSRKTRLPFTNSLTYWQEVSRLLQDFISENQVSPDRLLGVSLSLQVPIQNGSAMMPAIPDVDGESSASWNFNLIRQSLGQDVIIQNDAKMASMSQAWGGDQNRDIIYLMLSSGVGGAIITERHLLNENSKNAEFGHMVLHDGGRQCSCGQRGCLGAYCSTRAIQDIAGCDLDTFFASLTAKDESALGIWTEYLDNLALAINNIRVIFDTDVIIGGEMSSYIADYLPELKSRLANRNPFGDAPDYIRIGSFGEFDSAIGAAMVHLDRFLS